MLLAPHTACAPPTACCRAGRGRGRRPSPPGRSPPQGTCWLSSPRARSARWAGGRVCACVCARECVCACARVRAHGGGCPTRPAQHRAAPAAAAAAVWHMRRVEHARGTGGLCRATLGVAAAEAHTRWPVATCPPHSRATRTHAPPRTHTGVPHPLLLPPTAAPLRARARPRQPLTHRARCACSAMGCASMGRTRWGGACG